MAAFPRVKLFLRFLLPDKVPDPANSKWAKECDLQPVPTQSHTKKKTRNGSGASLLGFKTGFLTETGRDEAAAADEHRQRDGRR